MNLLFSQTGILSIITLAAIFGGMGWFIHKMYVLSAKPDVKQEPIKHSAQH